MREEFGEVFEASINFTEQILLNGQIEILFPSM